MTSNTDDPSTQTNRLKKGSASGAVRDLSILEPQIVYQPIPHPKTPVIEGQTTPVWRVRFELAANTSIAFGIEINGEVILGRDSAPEVVDLRPYDADELGVSRRHAMLTPTLNKLYIMDLGSTNGTLRNGQPVGVRTPYDLLNGDTITLGRLQFVVRIVDRPKLTASLGDQPVELSDAILQIARAITSQLELPEVLRKVAETAMTLTSAGETGIWLVDQATGELRLEANHGIDDPAIQKMRLPVTGSLAGKVIETGKPVRATREPEGPQVKVKTGYLVEALIYVPISLGGVTFGVLAAAHRQTGKRFTARDERLLVAIAEFAAIAVQNSRLYQATDRALAQRVEELAGINELGRAVSSSLDLSTVHEVLIKQLQRRWDVETVGLWLLDATGENLRLYRRSGAGLPATFPVGRGLVGQVAQAGEAIFSNDVLNDPRRDPEMVAATGIEVRSLAAVPLLLQDRVVGVLALYNRQEGSFTEDDIHRLHSFANPVATAIHNAHLYAQSERERATVRATMNALSQPLMILDERGSTVVANEAAEALIADRMSDVFEAIGTSVGKTSESLINDTTYLTTVQHEPEVGTIVVMQDMTYIKRLEQTRAEFVHALSHDLKGPLTSIKGWTMLIRQTGVPLNELAEKFLGRISASADTVLRMIGQLLDIALLSDAPLTVMSDCDLVELAHRAVSDLEGAALVRGIKVDMSINGEPFAVHGDANRLYRSVLNLVENALKYSPDGAWVKVILDFTEDALNIIVQDSGPGISSADLPHVFERYFRGEQALSTKAGIGLGLSLVQATIKAHGGTVSARNADEGGAELKVTLPASLRVHPDEVP